MGLCVLYYVEYSLYNVKKVGFFLSGLELHFKAFADDEIIVAKVMRSFLTLYLICQFWALPIQQYIKI